MWRYGVIAAALVIFIVAIFAGFEYFQARQESAGTVVDMRGKDPVSVVLTDQGFEPAQIRIVQGTTVVFTTTRTVQFWPASDPHPTHTDYPAFDPKQPIDPGSSWSFVFGRAGDWGYHDHLRSYFTGTIYVAAKP